MREIQLTDTNQSVKQMEFLLGKPVDTKYHPDIGSAFHLNTQIGGVIKSLVIMGLTTNDIIHKEDRDAVVEVIKMTIKEHKKQPL